MTAADCDDEDPLTIDSCAAGGTAGAECTHTACAVACEDAADCGDGDSGTDDACLYPGTCQAACTHNDNGSADAAPELRIDAPADGFITNRTTLAVTGQMTPGSTLIINGNATAAAADGAFDSTVTLSEGSNTITAVASRNAKTTVRTLSVTLDTLAPVISTTAPADGATLDAAPSRVEITAEDAAGGTGLDHARTSITLDGETLAANYNTTTKSYTAQAAAQGSGAHILAITVEDNAGNTSSRAITYSIQSTGPKVKFTKVPGKAVQANDSTRDEMTPRTFPDYSVRREDHREKHEMPPAARQQEAQRETSEFHRLVKEKYPQPDTEAFDRMVRDRFTNQRRPPIAIAPGAIVPLRRNEELVAEVYESSSEVDESSITVTVDGAPVEFTYDAESRTITSENIPLTLSAHRAEITLMDELGNEGMALMSFNSSEIPAGFFASNTTVPGSIDIAQGQTFSVTFGADYSIGATATAFLYNADNSGIEDSSEMGVGACNTSRIIGDPIVLELLTQESPYNYATEATFITNIDENGNPAKTMRAIIIAAPIDENGDSTCAFSANHLTGPHAENVRLTNMTHPEMSTIATGETMAVDFSGTAGQAFECAAAPITYAYGASTSPIGIPTATETVSGQYHCEIPFTQVPLVDGQPAEGVIAMIVADGLNMEYSDDILAVRNGIEQLHISNLTRPGATDIIPGEIFSLSATGTPGLTTTDSYIADAAILHRGFVIIQSIGQLTEFPENSGRYYTSGVLATTATAPVAIRAFTGLQNSAPTTVYSTEVLTYLTATSSQQLPRITHLDGVPVSGNTADSTNMTPLFAGVSIPDARVNVYEFNIASQTIFMPATGTYTLQAQPVSSPGTLEDDFDDQSGIGAAWMPDSATLYENIDTTAGTLRMILPASGTAVFLRKDGTPYSGNLSTETDVMIPSYGNPQYADYRGSVQIIHDLDKNQATALHVNVRWDVDDTAAATSVIRITSPDLAVPCEASIPPPVYDTAYHITTDIQPTPAQVSVTVENASGTVGTLVCEGLTPPASATLDFAFSATSDTLTASTQTVVFDNFTTNLSIPGGYAIEVPNLKTSAGEYFDDMSSTAFFVSPCSDMTRTPPTPRTDRCTDGTKDIHAFLVQLNNVNGGNGSTVETMRITIYTAGDPYHYDDHASYIDSVMQTLVDTGSYFESYDIAGSTAALLARGEGQPFERSELLSYENLCSTVSGITDCQNGSYSLIGTATASTSGGFSIQSASLDSATSTHIIVAKTIVQGEPLSVSDPLIINPQITSPQDTLSPVIEVISDIPACTNDTAPTFTLSVNDDTDEAPAVSCSITATSHSGATTTIACGSEETSTPGQYAISPETAIPEGSAVITISAGDDYGNVATATITLAIDTSAPAPPSAVTVRPDSFTDTPYPYDNDSELFVTFSPASDNPGGCGIAAQYYNTAATGQDCIQLYLQGTFNQLTATASQYAISPLAEGTAISCLAAMDMAGNISDVTFSATSSIDFTPPALSALIATPSLIARNDSTTLTATIADRNPDAWQISITAPDGNTLFTQSHTIDIDENQATTTTQIEIPWETHDPVTLAPYAKGIYTASLLTTDLAFNYSNATTSISIILPSPPAITSPASGGQIRNFITTGISGTTDPNTVISLYIENASGTHQIGTATATTGSFSTTFNIAMQAGPYTLSAVATDYFGNFSATSTPVPVTVLPVTPPVITTATFDNRYISPSYSSGIKDSLSIAATASIEDNYFSNWHISITDNAANVVFEHEIPIPSTATISEMTYQWNGTDNTDTPLAEGTYLVSITTLDLPGNSSNIATSSVTIDNTPPATGIQTPADNSAIGGTSYEALYVANDPNPLQAASLAIDSTEIHTYTHNQPSENEQPPASITVTTKILPHTLDSATSHTLTASATDLAGNTATHTITFTIDTTPPAPLINLHTETNQYGETILTWDPPTTNEDGTPLTDLAGYTIQTATYTQGCDPITPDPDSTINTITCSLNASATPPTLAITAPNLFYNSTTYNNTPFTTNTTTGNNNGNNGNTSGNTAANPHWIDTNSTATPTTSSSTTIIPLTPTTTITPDPTKPIFTYLITLTTATQTVITMQYDTTNPTQATQTTTTIVTPTYLGNPLATGTHHITAYTQSTTTQLTSLLTSLAQSGIISPDFTISAHSIACTPDTIASPPSGFTSSTFPMFSTPTQQTSSSSNTTSTSISLDNLTSTIYSISPTDNTGNTGDMSNITVNMY